MTHAVDEVLVRDEAGRVLRMTPEQFFALPLSERIRRVIERRVEFRRRGVVVGVNEALAEFRRAHAA